MSKSSDDFYRRSDNGYAARSSCKTCILQSLAKKRAQNLDRARAIGRASYRKNLDKNRERARDRARQSRGARRVRHLMKYGLTESAHANLVAAQGAKCAICRQPCTALNVDHDHISGVVRGLLCANCNKALGLFRDDPQRLMNAAMYLRKTSLREVV